MEPFANGRLVRQPTDQSPILGTTITVDRLKKRGYVSLLEIYMKIGLPSIKGGGSIHFPTI